MEHTPEHTTPPPPPSSRAMGLDHGEVHNKIGQLTRQLHDALCELGYADRLRDSAQELPDAQNRLSYIARLTGQAAEKVLSLVDSAKERQTTIVEQTKQMRQSMIADPVSAVAKGHIMNYLEEMEQSTEIVDQQLTDIMMAQDFHDLTGQVIAKVVTLASNLENQLVALLVQTAPAQPGLAQPAQEVAAPTASADEAEDIWAAALAESSGAGGVGQDQEDVQETARPSHPRLEGPVVDPNAKDVVTSQSQVDDLLASLGF